MNAKRVACRQARATELALAGYDYDTIATDLGCSNRSGAWKAVQRVLGQRTDAAVEDYRRGTGVLSREVGLGGWHPGGNTTE